MSIPTIEMLTKFSGAHVFVYGSHDFSCTPTTKTLFDRVTELSRCSLCLFPLCQTNPETLSIRETSSKTKMWTQTHARKWMHERKLIQSAVVIVVAWDYPNENKIVYIKYTEGNFAGEIQTKCLFGRKSYSPHFIGLDIWNE